MNTESILNKLDKEIARLQEVRNILSGLLTSTKTRKAKGSPAPAKRALSTEARARIAAAQKKRWAAQKKAAKM